MKIERKSEIEGDFEKNKNMFKLNKLIKTRPSYLAQVSLFQIGTRHKKWGS